MVRLFKRHLSSQRGLAPTEMLKFRNPAIQSPGAKTASAHMVFILRKKVEVFAAEVLRNHEINCNHLNQFCNSQKPKTSAPNLLVILKNYFTQRPLNPEIKKSKNPGVQNSSAKTGSAHMPFILRKKLKFLLQRC